MAADTYDHKTRGGSCHFGQDIELELRTREYTMNCIARTIRALELTNKGEMTMPPPMPSKLDNTPATMHMALIISVVRGVQ